MLKLAIVLCIVSIASANVFDFFNQIGNNVQDEVATNTIKILDESKTTLQTIEADVDEKSKKLADKANEYLKIAVNAVKGFLQQYHNVIMRHSREVRDVSAATQCHEFGDHLHRTGMAIIDNIKQCLTDNLNAGMNDTIHVKETITETLMKIQNARNDIDKCSRNLDGESVLIGRVSCTAKVIGQTMLVTTTAIPSITFDVAKITTRMVTVVPSFAICASVSGISNFAMEVTSIISKTRNCLNETIGRVTGGKKDTSADTTQATTAALPPKEKSTSQDTPTAEVPPKEDSTSQETE